MEAEFEVQRTTKRAELTAFFCLLKKVFRPINIHVDNKGNISGLWKGGRFVEKLGRIAPHVKAHRTKKDNKEMPHFEKLSLMAMKKQMSWRRQVRLWTKDLWRRRAKTVQQEKEERGARSLAVRSQLSLPGGGMEGL